MVVSSSRSWKKREISRLVNEFLISDPVREPSVARRVLRWMPVRVSLWTMWNRTIRVCYFSFLSRRLKRAYICIAYDSAERAGDLMRIDKGRARFVSAWRRRWWHSEGSGHYRLYYVRHEVLVFVSFFPCFFFSLPLAVQFRLVREIVASQQCVIAKNTRPLLRPLSLVPSLWGALLFFVFLVSLITLSFSYSSDREPRWIKLGPLSWDRWPTGKIDGWRNDSHRLQHAIVKCATDYWFFFLFFFSRDGLFVIRDCELVGSDHH